MDINNSKSNLEVEWRMGQGEEELNMPCVPLWAKPGGFLPKEGTQFFLRLFTWFPPKPRTSSSPPLYLLIYNSLFFFLFSLILIIYATQKQASKQAIRETNQKKKKKTLCWSVTLANIYLSTWKWDFPHLSVYNISLILIDIHKCGIYKK